MKAQLFGYMFRYHEIIFNKSDELSARTLSDDLQRNSWHSEEEKVEFVLQQWQKFTLVAHKYQIEKLIDQVKECWPDLDEVGRVLELVQLIPEEGEDENRKGYFRVIEYLVNFI